MQAVDTKGLQELDRALGGLLKTLPGARRELHHDLAALLKEEVDANITESVVDSRGKIRRWQQPHVGSRGGYAAIRAIGSTEGAPTGKDSPGAITNYLESGHKIRLPGGGKRYRPKINVLYVNGRHFYQSTRRTAEPKAMRLARDFADRVGEGIAGGGAP